MSHQYPAVSVSGPPQVEVVPDQEAVPLRGSYPQQEVCQVQLSSEQQPAAYQSVLNLQVEPGSHL